MKKVKIWYGQTTCYAIGDLFSGWYLTVNSDDSKVS